MSYPQGTCGQKAPDGSCGVKSFSFNYPYDYSDPTKVYFHRFNIEVDPATGQATGGVVKEIIIDSTYQGKYDIEDSPPNIQNKEHATSHALIRTLRDLFLYHKEKKFVYVQNP